MMREPNDREDIDEPAWARAAAGILIAAAAIAAVGVLYTALR